MISKSKNVTIVKLQTKKNELFYSRTILLPNENPENYYKVFLMNSTSKTTTQQDIYKAMEKFVFFDKIDTLKEILTPVMNDILGFFNDNTNVSKKSKTLRIKN